MFDYQSEMGKNRGKRSALDKSGSKPHVNVVSTRGTSKKSDSKVDDRASGSQSVNADAKYSDRARTEKNKPDTHDTDVHDRNDDGKYRDTHNADSTDNEYSDGESRYDDMRNKNQNDESYKGDRNQITAQIDVQAIIQTAIRETGKLMKNNDGGSFRNIGAFVKVCESKKITFSADTNENLNKFLRQCEDVMLSFRMRDEDKMYAVGNLMKGRAETWLTGKRGKFKTFEEMKDALRQWHLPDDHEFRLKSSLRSKKQKVGERLSDYISDILALNMDLQEPLEEEEIVKCIIMNMNFKYKGLIGRDCKNFTTITELENAGKHASEVLDEEEAYKSKSKNFYASGTRGKVAAMSEISEEDKPPDKEADVDAFEKDHSKWKAEMKCHNCEKFGHFWRECPSARRVFCKACGKKGVDEKICACNQSGQMTNLVKSIVEMTVKQLQENQTA